MTELSLISVKTLISVIYSRGLKEIKYVEDAVKTMAMGPGGFS